MTTTTFIKRYNHLTSKLYPARDLLLCRGKAATQVVRLSLEQFQAEASRFADDDGEWEVRLADRVEFIHRCVVVAFDHEALVLRVGQVRQDASDGEAERLAFVSATFLNPLRKRTCSEAADLFSLC